MLEMIFASDLGKHGVKEHYSCIQNVVAFLYEKETIITHYTLQYLKLLNNATKTM